MVMKTLVIYDSCFGNTEQIARAMAEALGTAEGVKIDSLEPQHLEGVDLLLVGSPTQSFRPTPAIMNWIQSLPTRRLQGVRVAGFDTRIPMDDPGVPGIMRFAVRLIGQRVYAAPAIVKGLVGRGGQMTVPPEGFFVTTDKEPTLIDDELGRAVAWAQRVASTRG